MKPLGAAAEPSAVLSTAMIAPAWIEKNRRGSQRTTTANPPKVGDSDFYQITR